jgi:hypothetical protein
MRAANTTSIHGDTKQLIEVIKPHLPSLFFLHQQKPIDSERFNAILPVMVEGF